MTVIPPDRKLPDPSICRTRYLDEHLSDCLVLNPVECSFALRFGYEYFCRHPDRRTFERALPSNPA